jgi:hypothetical protein
MCWSFVIIISIRGLVRKETWWWSRLAHSRRSHSGWAHPRGRWNHSRRSHSRRSHPGRSHSRWRWDHSRRSHSRRSHPGRSHSRWRWDHPRWDHPWWCIEIPSVLPSIGWRSHCVVRCYVSIAVSVSVCLTAFWLWLEGIRCFTLDVKCQK